MAKLYFDNSAVKQNVVNSLIDTVDHLSQAISKSNSLSIPSGFSYSSFLSSLGSSLSQIQSDLIDLKDCVNRSSDVYTTHVGQMESDISTMDKITVTPHRSIIN